MALPRLYKTVTLCQGQNLVVGIPITSRNAYSPVAWITPTGIVNNDTFIIDGANSVVGNLTLTFDDTTYDRFGTPTTRQYFITVQIEACTLYDACCDGLNIVWFNREGGKQNYYFNGIKTSEIRQNDAATFTNSDRELLDIRAGKTYYSYIATTKAIPRAHVDLLDSLRMAIRAWIVNADGTYTAIKLDKDNYTKYTTRKDVDTVSIRFVVAEEINIQSA